MAVPRPVLYVLPGWSGRGLANVHGARVVHSGMANLIPIFILNAVAAMNSAVETASLTPGVRADLSTPAKHPATIAPTRMKDLPIIGQLVGGKVIWGSADKLPTVR